MRNCITVAMLLLFVSIGTGKTQVKNTYYQGQAIFKAPPSIVTLPVSVQGIIIDTSKCGRCKDTLPAFRFLGDILVDSIIYVDSTRRVDSAQQMQGISIESSKLQSALRRARAYRLARSFRGVIPSDTLRLNSVTKRVDKLPDLSWDYDLRFDSSITFDSVYKLLSAVKGLVSHGGTPIPVKDVSDD
jgi:hypothetical protein